jgi:hypothetical protein
MNWSWVCSNSKIIANDLAAWTDPRLQVLYMGGLMFWAELRVTDTHPSTKTKRQTHPFKNLEKPFKFWLDCNQPMRNSLEMSFSISASTDSTWSDIDFRIASIRMNCIIAVVLQHLSLQIHKHYRRVNEVYTSKCNASHNPNRYHEART